MWEVYADITLYNEEFEAVHRLTAHTNVEADTDWEAICKATKDWEKIFSGYMNYEVDIDNILAVG